MGGFLWLVYGISHGMVNNSRCSLYNENRKTPAVRRQDFRLATGCICKTIA